MRAGWIGSASAPSSSASRSAAARDRVLQVGRPRPTSPGGGDLLERRPAGRRRTAVRSPDDRARRASAWPRDLAGGVGDVHDPGRRGAVLAAEDAVAEPEVQRRADHDDQVGAAERRAAGLGDQQRVAAGDDAAAHAVGDRRDARRPRRSAARPPRRRRPRRRCRGSAPAARRAGEQPGDPRRARRRRARRRAARRRPGAGPDAELKNSSIGTSTNTGPRCEEPRRR